MTDPISRATGGLFGAAGGIAPATAGLLQSAVQHQRTAIRKRVRDLFAGATAAENRVWPSRARSLPAIEQGQRVADYYPLILVYTTRERVIETNADELAWMRQVELVVEVVAAGTSGDAAEDQADAIQGVCEFLILMDRDEDESGELRYLGGCASKVALGDADSSIDGEKTSPVLVRVAQTFLIDYWDSFGGYPLNALDEIRLKWDLAPTDGTLEAQDDLDLT